MCVQNLQTANNDSSHKSGHTDLPDLLLRILISIMVSAVLSLYLLGICSIPKLAQHLHRLHRRLCTDLATKIFENQEHLLLHRYADAVLCCRLSCMEYNGPMCRIALSQRGQCIMSLLDYVLPHHSSPNTVLVLVKLSFTTN